MTDTSDLRIILDYLQQEFPIGEVQRLRRAGVDPPEHGIQFHDRDAEIFVVNTSGHRLDVAFSDDVLEENTGERLSNLLKSYRVAERMRDLDKRQRLWVMSDHLTVARRDEEPS